MSRPIPSPAEFPPALLPVASHLPRPSATRIYSMPLPILNVPFDLIGYQDVLSRIEDWRNSGKRSFVSLVNPFSVIQSMRDPAMFEAIRAAGAVLPDGIGITLAAEMLGYPHKGRVAGPSLML